MTNAEALAYIRGRNHRLASEQAKANQAALVANLAGLGHGPDPFTPSPQVSPHSSPTGRPGSGTSHSGGPVCPSTLCPPSGSRVSATSSEGFDERGCDA